MANRSNESDDFDQRNTPTCQLSPAGFEESEERVIRRSDMIALERKLPMRRSPTGTTDKPILVQEKVKRKRRPPKIPWKKPAGMPKRPLSAYNLFFACERERLIKVAHSEKEKEAKAADNMNVDTHPLASPKIGGSGNDDESDQTKEPPSSPQKPGRRHTRTSGIGFANLAKTIASAWNSLDDENRAIFVGQAASEKERYQAEMMIWRAKQQKAKSANAENEARAASKPKVLKRRQSSPPGARFKALPKSKPGNPPQSVRRASEPMITSPAFAFSFDKATNPYKSESSSWAEPMDGGSLGSVDQDRESTLDFDMSGSRDRPTPRRSYSDSMIQIRPDHYHVRLCEELAADVGGAPAHRVAAVAAREETTESATNSSLQALKASLDDDMVDFIATLSKSER